MQMTLGASDLPPELTPPAAAVLVGPFGVGKTEVAINLAVRWARARPTFLADLDIVTPYFRPRDIADALAAQGVTVVAPQGAQATHDGPALPAALGAAVADAASGLVIDVGGQPQGAGVLLHWQEALLARGANLLLVVNPRRPGAQSPAAMVALAQAIAGRTGLPLRGVLANGNLGPQTTVGHALEGLELADAVASALGVPVSAVCCPEDLSEACRAAVGAVPVFGLSFYLRPSWQRA
jgi:hypothetical protein